MTDRSGERMREQLFIGDWYRVCVEAMRGCVIVQVQSTNYGYPWGAGPGYTKCHIGPRVWWKPWTWRTLDGAIRRCNRIARRLEEQEARAVRTAWEYRSTAELSLPPKASFGGGYVGTPNPLAEERKPHNDQHRESLDTRQCG